MKSILKRIFRPRIEVVTFNRKAINRRKMVHDVCDRLRTEAGLKPINWEKSYEGNN